MSSITFRTNVKIPPGCERRQDFVGLLTIQVPNYEVLRQFGFDSQFRKLPGLYLVHHEGMTYHVEAAGNNYGIMGVRCVEFMEELRDFLS